MRTETTFSIQDYPEPIIVRLHNFPNCKPVVRMPQDISASHNMRCFILIELREFRATVTEWEQGMGEWVSSIETTIKPAILGHGQPSRLASAESRISELEKTQWKQAGAYALCPPLRLSDGNWSKKYVLGM
jgi:hypothetical protein